MGAESPRIAADQFLQLLRQALSCLTDEYLVGEPAIGRQSSVIFLSAARNRAYIRPPSSHRELRGIGALEFRFTHGYELVEERDEWRVRTPHSTYEFQHTDGREIVAYHYNPGRGQKVKTPHYHLRGLTGPLPLSRAHFPTGHVSIEEVVRFAITELGVPPRYPHGDWQARLDQTEAAFFARRPW